MSFRKSAGVNSLVFPLAISLVAGPCGQFALSDSHRGATIGHTTQKAATAHSVQKKTPAPPLVEKYLEEGKLKDGETVLLAELKAHPHNDQLRFSLGSLQFLRAVENLSQALYRYGFGNGTLRSFHQGSLPALPLAISPDPENLSYEKARDIARAFLQDLEKAEASLAAITAADVELPLHFGMIRLDLNGDGQASEDETLWKLYAGLNHEQNVSVDKAKEFFIDFDRGDVHWLRGYCHMFMAACELYLAHDTKETFDCTAQLFFNKVDSPYKFLRETSTSFHNEGEILDLIALIHLIHWPVVEPERMTAALHHFENVTKQSKESWKWIMAEKGDDHEWLPNPEQTGVIPNVHITQEMIDTWLHLMDQTAKVLAGEQLIPFGEAMTALE